MERHAVNTQRNGMLPAFNRNSATCTDENFPPPDVSGKAEMAEGVIKKVLDKGFGFITTMKGKDLFFHSSAVQGIDFNQLISGQKVTYTDGMGKTGPCADNVKPV